MTTFAAPYSAEAAIASRARRSISGASASMAAAVMRPGHLRSSHGQDRRCPRGRLDRRVDLAAAGVEAHAQERAAVRGVGRPRAAGEVLDHVDGSVAAGQEALGRVATHVAGVELDLLEAHVLPRARRRRAHDQDGDVVVEAPDELPRLVDEVAAVPGRAEPDEEPLEAFPTEERAVGARLDEAVGEEACAVAVAEDHGGLAPAGR